MSTIYYLCTYLYCDSLPGQPCAQNAPTHTYTGRESIFPPLSPRQRAHTHTHTRAQHTQASHKNAHLPLGAAHLLSHDCSSQIQGHKISPPLNLSSFQLFLFSSCFSYSANVRSRSPHTLESFENTHRERHSMYWSLQSCQVFFFEKLLLAGRSHNGPLLV